MLVCKQFLDEAVPVYLQDNTFYFKEDNSFALCLMTTNFFHKESTKFISCL